MTPGEAVLRRADDGTVTVLSADPVIRVSLELLESDLEPWAWNGTTLQLDTAGEYRYEYLRPDPSGVRVAIFGRIKA